MIAQKAERKDTFKRNRVIPIEQESPRQHKRNRSRFSQHQRGYLYVLVEIKIAWPFPTASDPCIACFPKAECNSIRRIIFILGSPKDAT